MTATAVLIMAIVTVGIMIKKGIEEKQVSIRQPRPACKKEQAYQDGYTNLCRCIESITDLWQVDTTSRAIKIFQAAYRRHKDPQLLRYDIGQLNIRLDARRELILSGEIVHLSTG